MRVMFQYQLFELEHVALEFLGQCGLPYLHLAGLHVRRERPPAVIALHNHDFEHHCQLFLHLHVVQHIFLDLDADFQVLVGHIGEYPPCLEDCEEFQLVDLAEADLQ